MGNTDEAEGGMTYGHGLCARTDVTCAYKKVGQTKPSRKWFSPCS